MDVRLTLVALGAIFMGAAGLYARKAAAASLLTDEAVDPRPTQADVTGHPHSEPWGARPGVGAFRKYVLGKWGGKDDGIWGDAAHLSEASSEHNVGTAWDWGQPTPDAGLAFIAWLQANDDAWARRFGVGYIIFQRRMYRVYAPERGWTAYTGPDPHTGHVHFSFSRAGAMGKTSGYALLSQGKIP